MLPVDEHNRHHVSEREGVVPGVAGNRLEDRLGRGIAGRALALPQLSHPLPSSCCVWQCTEGGNEGRGGGGRGKGGGGTLVWFGLVWFGLVLVFGVRCLVFGLVWLGSAWFALVWLVRWLFSSAGWFDWLINWLV